MMVVAILGIVLAMGVPSILRVMRKEGMRKALTEVKEVCDTARARAIMSGATATLVFHPLERRLDIEGGGGWGGNGKPGDALASAQLPEDVNIEMLDINLLEYRESEVARVRFFPNGTSDEMTLILRSAENEWNAISLEITTGLVRVESDPQRFGR
jgi:Tfp pilus assembly protein FimT